MMNIRGIRLENLRYWENKLGRKLLAEKAGYSDTNYLNQLLSGHENMGGRTARKFERGLGLPEGWMDVLHHSDQPQQNVTALNRPLSRVPLLSWIKAGEYCESPDNFEPGDAEAWLETPFNHGPYAFCLRVSGPSMLPDYRDGEIILVDPDTEAEHNSDVVVRTPDPGPRQTFKRLQITPEGTYLLALNPDWENRIIAMPEGTEICGVVIGSWIKRR